MAKLSVANVNIGGINKTPFEFGIGVPEHCTMDDKSAKDPDNDNKQLSLNTKVKNFSSLITVKEFLEEATKIESLDTKYNYLFNDDGKLKAYSFAQPIYDKKLDETDSKLTSAFQDLSPWSGKCLASISAAVVADEFKTMKEEDQLGYLIKAVLLTYEETPTKNDGGVKDAKDFPEHIIKPNYVGKDTTNTIKPDDTLVLGVSDTNPPIGTEIDIKINQYFNGGAYALVYHMVKLIYEHSKLNGYEWLDNQENEKTLKNQKIKLLKKLLDKYQIVCVNEMIDDLVPPGLENLKHIHSSGEKYCSIMSTVPSITIEKNAISDIIKDDPITPPNEHISAICNGFNIVCVHANSHMGGAKDRGIDTTSGSAYTQGHKELFTEFLNKLESVVNLVLCVDSNSPWTTVNDIHRNLKLAAPNGPINGNTLVDKCKSEVKLDKVKNEPCKTDGTSPVNFTTNKTRTFLQQQLNKAGKLDKSAKDFIIISNNLTSTDAQVLEQVQNEELVTAKSQIPTANFPLDHFIVTSEISLGGDPAQVESETFDEALDRIIEEQVGNPTYISVKDELIRLFGRKKFEAKKIMVQEALREAQMATRTKKNPQVLPNIEKLEKDNNGQYILMKGLVLKRGHENTKGIFAKAFRRGGIESIKQRWLVLTTDGKEENPTFNLTWYTDDTMKTRKGGLSDVINIMDCQAIGQPPSKYCVDKNWMLADTYISDILYFKPVASLEDRIKWVKAATYLPMHEDMAGGRSKRRSRKRASKKRRRSVATRRRSVATRRRSVATRRRRHSMKGGRRKSKGRSVGSRKRRRSVGSRKRRRSVGSRKRRRSVGSRKRRKSMTGGRKRRKSSKKSTKSKGRKSKGRKSKGRKSNKRSSKKRVNKARVQSKKRKSSTKSRNYKRKHSRSKGKRTKRC
jgi:hypothetical protein